MGSKFLHLQWCPLFLFFFVVSCSLNLEMKRPEGGEEFLQETSRLEKLAREDPATPVRAQCHLKLAFLYVNSRNPQLNYARALQEMESYFSMSPAKTQKDDFRNWLAVLREMDHLCKDRMEVKRKNQTIRVQSDKLQAGLEKVQKANTHLRDEVVSLERMNNKLQAGLEKVQKANTYLRDEVASLKEINNKMIETIEKLKILDFQMEEKRSLMK